MIEPKIKKNTALRVRLAELDLSFSELARRAGLHPVTISRVYNGHWRLSPATALRVAKVLKSSPGELGLYPDPRFIVKSRGSHYE